MYNIYAGGFKNNTYTRNWQAPSDPVHQQKLHRVCLTKANPMVYYNVGPPTYKLVYKPQ